MSLQAHRPNVKVVAAVSPEQVEPALVDRGASVVDRKIGAPSPLVPQIPPLGPGFGLNGTSAVVQAPERQPWLAAHFTQPLPQWSRSSCTSVQVWPHAFRPKPQPPTHL